MKRRYSFWVRTRAWLKALSCASAIVTLNCGRVERCDDVPVPTLMDACVGGQHPHPRSLPIHVMPDGVKGLKDAITIWNRSIGTEVLTLDRCDGCPIVTVSYTTESMSTLIRKELGPNTVAATTVISDEMCNFQMSAIFLLTGFDELSSDEKDVTFRHEFGHVLGLSHDSGKHSLMSSTAQDCVPAQGHIDWVKSQL